MLMFISMPVKLPLMIYFEMCIITVLNAGECGCDGLCWLTYAVPVAQWAT